MHTGIGLSPRLDPRPGLKAVLMELIGAFLKSVQSLQDGYKYGYRRQFVTPNDLVFNALSHETGPVLGPASARMCNRGRARPRWTVRRTRP